MSFTPRNIVADGPDAFNLALRAEYNSGLTAIEASPIYTSLSGSVYINGSYSSFDYDYDFDKTIILDPRARSNIRTGTTIIEEENYEVERVGAVSTYADLPDIFSAFGHSSSEVVIMHGAPVSITGQTVPFAPPAYSITGLSVTDTQAGTETDEDNNVTDITGVFSVSVPQFRGSVEGGDLEMYFLMQANISDGPNFEHAIDASSWDSADFRDIRGTYGTTSVDSNGVSYTWSLTLA